MVQLTTTKFRPGDSFGHGLTSSARIVCHTHDSEVLVIPREPYDEVMGCKVGGDIEEVLEVFQKRYVALVVVGCGIFGDFADLPFYLAPIVTQRLIYLLSFKNRLMLVCSPSDRTAADLAHVVAIIGVRPFFRQFTVEKIEALCSAIE